MVNALPYRALPNHDAQGTIGVGTQAITLVGLQGGLATWLVWGALFGWLALMTRIPSQASTEVYLGGAMVAMGLLPALVVTHLVSRRTRQNITVDRHGIAADKTVLIRFDGPFHATSLDLGERSALLLHQAGSWVILHAQPSELSAFSELRNHYKLLAPSEQARSFFNGELWGSYWSVHSKGGIVIGEVDREADLDVLRLHLRGAAEQSAASRFAAPTADPSCPALWVDAQGRLHAFGSEIDLSRPFSIQPIWSFGMQNSRSDLDAILVQQGDSTVCLSMSRRPGGWPALGALPSAAPELPTPELPAEQVLNPSTFVVLNAFLRQCQQREGATAIG